MEAQSTEGRGAVKRPQWTSQRAFILASVAGAVGLGSLWRFPYIVGENGGGTFIVAYLVCILAVGLPLFILETSGGSLVNRGPVGLFRGIGGKYGSWFGWLVVGVVLMVMSYYLVVTGWSLGYFVDAVRVGPKHFADFSSGYASVWWFFAAGVLVFLVVRRGVRSVEWLAKILMPLLIVMVAALAIYAQTLDGGGRALEFYGSFDLATFLAPRTWQVAAGQAFYSLGVGTGILITYGSYIPKNVNIVTSSAAVTVTNSVIALAAGIMVFSVIFTFGMAPDTGSELSFVAFPRIFDELTGGRFIAIVFFGLLFSAAFTSSYSWLMVVVAPLREELRMSNGRSALIATGTMLALGIPSALSFTPLQLKIGDMHVLDWVDQLTGSGIVVVVGLVGVALIAWRLPRAKLVGEMSARVWRVGPVRFSPYAIVAFGRYIPAAVVLLLIVTAIV